MAMFFSPARLAFYADDLRADYDAAGSWPPDATAITDTVWRQFIGQPPSGKVLGVTAGAPAWVNSPTASLEDQAAAELATRIAAGIAITSTGTPALSATYALDSNTMDQIGSVARDFGAGLGLPGDIATFTYPDAGGVPRTFTGAQLTALYRQQRNLLSVLNTTAAMMAHGAPPQWPAQTATIP